MTNETIEIIKEEEVKGNRFTKHLKRNKDLYVGVASIGAGLTGLGISYKMLNAELRRAYYAGGMRMHDIVWEYLADKAKDGVLKIELIGETDDKSLKNNIEYLNSIVASKED